MAQAGMASSHLRFAQASDDFVSIQMIEMLQQWSKSNGRQTGIPVYCDLQLRQ
jgi:hypothetical protein